MNHINPEHSNRCILLCQRIKMKDLLDYIEYRKFLKKAKRQILSFFKYNFSCPNLFYFLCVLLNSQKPIKYHPRKLDLGLLLRLLDQSDRYEFPSPNCRNQMSLDLINDVLDTIEEFCLTQ